MATLKAIAFNSMVIVGLAEHAQGQQCLHRSDESAGERLRRQAAVKFVDDVNIAQARRQRETGRYASLADVQQAATAPLGFVPRLVMDQFGYAIKVVDALDPSGSRSSRTSAASSSRHIRPSVNPSKSAASSLMQVVLTTSNAHQSMIVSTPTQD